MYESLGGCTAPDFAIARSAFDVRRANVRTANRHDECLQRPQGRSGTANELTLPTIQQRLGACTENLSRRHASTAWRIQRDRLKFSPVATRRKVLPIADATSSLFDAAEEAAKSQRVERPLAVPGLRIGTSAFTAAGWPGSFYPSELKPRDYLAHYATYVVRSIM